MFANQTPEPSSVGPQNKGSSGIVPSLETALIKAVPLSLSEIFDAWEKGKYGRLEPRLISPANGRIFVQVPGEYSLIQMCIDGAPFAWDRAGGVSDAKPSLPGDSGLFMDRISENMKAHPHLLLYPSEVDLIREEANDVFRRLKALLQVGFWEKAVRDSEFYIRSMEVLAIRAASEEDRQEFLRKKVEGIELGAHAAMSQVIETTISKNINEVLGKALDRIDETGVERESGVAISARNRLDDFSRELTEKHKIKLPGTSSSKAPEVVKGREVVINPDLCLMLLGFPRMEGYRTVRLWRTRNGEGIVQQRIRGGLIEFYADGDPLGHTRYGYEQVISHYQKLQKIREIDGEEPGYWLNVKACMELWADDNLYYRRASLFKDLKHWDRALHDLETCFKYVQFLARHSGIEEQRKDAVVSLARLTGEMAEVKGGSAFEEMRYDKVLEAFNKARARFESVKSYPEYPDVRNQIEEVRRDFLRYEKAVMAKVPERTPAFRAYNLQREISAALSVEDYEKAAELKKRLDRIHWQRTPRTAEQ